jgi:hypothetical protein
VTVFFNQAVIATTENFGEEVGGHEYGACNTTLMDQHRSAILFYNLTEMGTTKRNKKPRAVTGNKKTGAILPSR